MSDEELSVLEAEVAITFRWLSGAGDQAAVNAIEDGIDDLLDRLHDLVADVDCSAVINGSQALW